MFYIKIGITDRTTSTVVGGRGDGEGVSINRRLTVKRGYNRVERCRYKLWLICETETHHSTRAEPTARQPWAGPRNARITYGRDHGETVNGRVDEAPRTSTAVRGRARLERVVQLLLEFYQFPAGRLFPLVRSHPPAVRPKSVQEVALHPLHAALVERLERAFRVTKHHTSHAAHDHQYHLCICHQRWTASGTRALTSGVPGKVLRLSPHPLF